jgi:prefoldin subunit 5
MAASNRTWRPLAPKSGRSQAAAAAGPQAKGGTATQKEPVWANLSLPIQCSLKVNQPGDQYEQEAEQVAEQVMRMPTAAGREEKVQQQTCACGKPQGPDGMCEDCKRKQEAVQRAATGNGASSEGVAGHSPPTPAPPIVHQALQQPGRPLDSATRHFMESRFGHDFGQVRVHTDGAAASSAEAVDARAYTVGQELVFNQGEYRPQTAAGKRLLAHELAHAQQGGGQTAAVQPDLFRKKGDKEESTKATKESLKAQQVFWEDLHAFFPNDGRKLAGSGYDPAVSRLEVSFLEGLVDGVSHSPPTMKVGKGYIAEKDADKRKAWIRVEIAKINKWRVETGRIDDQDVGDAAVTKWIDALDLSGKLDVLRKMEARKDLIANSRMQEFVRNRIHSTPLMAEAVTKDDGSFEVKYDNVKVVVKPDVYNSSQVAAGAETSIQPVGSPNFAFPGYTWDAKGKIDTISFTPTVPDVTYEIQTHYAPGVDPNSTSGYGVGTRAQDTGQQAKLRFHEGQHGEVFIRAVKNNIGSAKYPIWQGQINQKRKDFEDHLNNYKAGVQAFQKVLADALEASTQEVDCVGKTIVDYHTEHGTATTVKCQP